VLAHFRSCAGNLIFGTHSGLQPHLLNVGSNSGNRFERILRQAKHEFARFWAGGGLGFAEWQVTEYMLIAAEPLESIVAQEHK
jgi:hypothetical protein